jgi:hypothetical protein
MSKKKLNNMLSFQDWDMKTFKKKDKKTKRTETSVDVLMETHLNDLPPEIRDEAIKDYCCQAITQFGDQIDLERIYACVEGELERAGIPEDAVKDEDILDYMKRKREE